MTTVTYAIKSSSSTVNHDSKDSVVPATMSPPLLDDSSRVIATTSPHGHNSGISSLQKETMVQDSSAVVSMTTEQHCTEGRQKHNDTAGDSFLPLEEDSKYDDGTSHCASHDGNSNLKTSIKDDGVDLSSSSSSSSLPLPQTFVLREGTKQNFCLGISTPGGPFLSPIRRPKLMTASQKTSPSPEDMHVLDENSAWSPSNGEALSRSLSPLCSSASSVLSQDPVPDRSGQHPNEERSTCSFLNRWGRTTRFDDVTNTYRYHDQRRHRDNMLLQGEVVNSNVDGPKGGGDETFTRDDDYTHGFIIDRTGSSVPSSLRPRTPTSVTDGIGNTESHPPSASRCPESPLPNSSNGNDEEALVTRASCHGELSHHESGKLIPTLQGGGSDGDDYFQISFDPTASERPAAFQVGNDSNTRINGRHYDGNPKLSTPEVVAHEISHRPKSTKPPPLNRRIRAYHISRPSHHRSKYKAGEHSKTTSLRPIILSRTSRAMDKLVDTLSSNRPSGEDVTICFRNCYSCLTQIDNSKQDLIKAFGVLTSAIDRLTSHPPFVYCILQMFLDAVGHHGGRSMLVVMRGVLHAMRDHETNDGIHSLALPLLTDFTGLMVERAKTGDYSFFVAFCTEGGIEAVVCSRNIFPNKNHIEECNQLLRTYYDVAEDYIGMFSSSGNTHINEKNNCACIGVNANNTNKYNSGFPYTNISSMNFGGTHDDGDDGHSSNDDANPITMVPDIITHHNHHHQTTKFGMIDLTLRVAELVKFRLDAVNGST